MEELKLQNILKKYTKMDFQVNQELRTEALLGNKICLEPRELVQIYLELKKYCDNNNLKQAVINGRFKTYVDLLQL